jgi:hypothetical protein
VNKKTFGRLIALAVLAVGFSAAPASAQVAGDWSGSLSTPGGDLFLVLHIVDGEDALSATMDSPDQGAYGFAASSAEFAGDTLRIEFADISGAYVATVSDDGLDGTWSQMGQVFNLDLVPHESESEEESED